MTITSTFGTIVPNIEGDFPRVARVYTKVRFDGVQLSIKIDFDFMAEYILAIDRNARKHGLKIAKVIIKVEYKPHLFATTNGKKLRNSGIYVVRSLTPAVNQLHDEHFHIDFQPL